MSGSGLLAKLTRPASGSALERQRLFQRLASAPGAPASRLVWVSAPPGAGKTTLAASYVRWLGISDCWYQVDSGDADPASLFYYLARLADGRGAAPQPQYRPELHPGIAAFARGFFRAFFDAIGTPCVLVFDNCQEVADDARLFDALRVLADELPLGSQLLMLSRKRPPASFARARVNGDMVEFDAEDLKLTWQEARDLAASQVAGSVADERLAALVQATGAWTAGVVLALRRPAIGDVAAPEPGLPEDMLFDYFGAEILDLLPPADRQVLLRLSMLPWVGIVWDLRTPPAHILAGKATVAEVVSDAITPPAPSAALPSA